MTDDPRIGTTLADRYRLDDLLGTGGMGRVYAAEHVLMRKKLAVKVLHRELTTVPEVVKRFEREAMAAAHIEHPNVAAATDFGKLPDGSVFLVLEFVQGELLRDEVAKGPMPADRALRIARQIASALASAHELEIVHRDLKPENVMLVQKGKTNDFVKVLDFGIAKVPIGDLGELARDGHAITRAGMVFGTPEYMAPEQALGQSVDGRADLYALGTMLFEMLAGVRPYSSKSQVGILGQQLANPVPSFAVRAPGIGIPHSVEQVVHRLLARDPDDRFQTANEVVAAIDQLLLLTAPPEARLFTQLGGSPREMMGSYPGFEVDAKSGPIALPSFADESASGLVVPPELGSSDPASTDRAGFDNGLDPIGPSGAMLTPRAKPSSAKGIELLQRLNHGPLLRGAIKFVEARRSSLPPPIGKAFKGVPGLAILAGIGLALLGLSGVLLAVFVSSLGAGADRPLPSGQGSAVAAADARAVPSVAAVPAPTDSAPLSLAEAVRKAESEGVLALEALAKAHPSDGTVLLALAQGRVDAKQYAEAVKTIGAALEVDPELKVSKKVASLLFTTAQSKSGRDRTFELLQGPMGSRGADIVYDIAAHPTIKPAVKTRAEQYLKSEAFDRASSPELNIAVALRYAARCEHKHALLLRAKNVGDKRSLPYLEPLTKTEGCGTGGKNDCYPCLRSDARLADAIAAVKARAPRK